MDSVDLEELLRTTANYVERVRGLLELGLTPGIIAKVTGATSSTVRNWSLGQNQPRADAAEALDDLRMIARELLDRLDPDRVAHWLLSRDPAQFDGSRPIDLVAQDAMAVLEAARRLPLKT